MPLAYQDASHISSQAVTVWTALDKTTKENGALQVCGCSSCRVLPLPLPAAVAAALLHLHLQARPRAVAVAAACCWARMPLTTSDGQIAPGTHKRGRIAFGATTCDTASVLGARPTFTPRMRAFGRTMSR